ncbi:MAG: heme-binding protein [Aigarchaeota archaeon]|nr:heme-binding protein [Candidatus Pelearchaeum maunauluense]
MNLEQAKQIVEAGIRKAESMGVKVSIAVVNAHGELILLARMDGAIAASPQIAWGKATTSAIFRRRTGEFQQRIQENPAFWAGISVMSGGRMLFGRGGVPIKRGDETIGAVGVSGATSEEDEEIALEAIKQLEK